MNVKTTVPVLESTSERRPFSYMSLKCFFSSIPYEIILLVANGASKHTSIKSSVQGLAEDVTWKSMGPTFLTRSDCPSGCTRSLSLWGSFKLSLIAHKVSFGPSVQNPSTMNNIFVIDYSKSHMHTASIAATPAFRLLIEAVHRNIFGFAEVVACPSLISHLFAASPNIWKNVLLDSLGATQVDSNRLYKYSVRLLSYLAIIT